MGVEMSDEAGPGGGWWEKKTGLGDRESAITSPIDWGIKQRPYLY